MQAGGKKAKILYLLKILMENTDKLHGITMAEIRSNLKLYGISADRKTIYDDVETLQLYGIDIIKVKEANTYTYRIGNREFEVPEVQILVDTVLSSKFISPKKTLILVKKLEGLISKHDASVIQKNVIVNGRNKAINSNFYNIVNDVHDAIRQQKKIKFDYQKWNVRCELETVEVIYEFCPIDVLIHNENYYVVGYDEREKIVHYRVDKMCNLSILSRHDNSNKEKRDDLSEYSKKLVGSSGGEIKKITLICDNSLADKIIDQFGTDIRMHSVNSKKFRADVSAVVNIELLCWIFSLGKGASILGPVDVVYMMKQEAARIYNQYV